MAFGGTTSQPHQLTSTAIKSHKTNARVRKKELKIQSSRFLLAKISRFLCVLAFARKMTSEFLSICFLLFVAPELVKEKTKSKKC